MAEPAPEGPYFFFSYAHTPKHAGSEEGDPDVWVGKLFDKICEHIANLTDVPAGMAGFMDRDLRPGEQWPQRLTDALATARVFVPLYSPRYFASAQCGQEWFAFKRRTLGERAISFPVEPIVPALWVPMPQEMLPETAKAIQSDHQDIGDRLYAEHGFFGIMKISRFRDDYELAAYELARRIIEVAGQARIEPGPATDYESLENAFGSVDTAEPARKNLLVTVAASDETGLPGGRDSAYYGPTALDWNPYRPQAARPIAEYAISLAGSLGYQSSAASLAERADELLSHDPPTAPSVLLVDPWIVTEPESLQVLREIDRADNPWVSVVIPWNAKDEETAAEADTLRRRLQDAMPRKLSEDRAASVIAVNGVPTMQDFGMVVPVVMSTVARHYLKHAKEFPHLSSADG